MKRLIPLMSLFSLTLAFAAIAQAAERPEDPMQMLQRGVDEVMAIAYDGAGDQGQPLSERVRHVLRKYFDFDAVTRRAVGPGWRKLSEEERSRVTELFSTLVLRTYADSFEPGERPEVKYGSAIELSSTRRELPTTVVYAGKNYAVSYRVELNDSRWQVYDVIIEGVSMIANYRAQFESILRNGGGGALIDSLENNLKNVTKPT
ncbi:MAG: MlaC/ttg2D family ABC transporter substrate-binding protein [Opitutaceae bacterium]